MTTTGAGTDTGTRDEHGRPEPPHDAGEAATLLGFLDHQRATLAWKCDGLDDAQLRQPLPSSTMTLGGLLKHQACNEDAWITVVAGGRPEPEPWAGVDWDADPDWEWRTAADDGGEAVRALWAASVERSRAVVATLLADPAGEAAALAATHRDGDRRYSLRWVITHLIEEYARHNGHADLLREAIDGTTGE